MAIRTNPTITPLYDKFNPGLLLVVTLAVTMIGFQFLGGFIGILFAFPFYGGGMDMFIQGLLNPTADANMRTPFLVMQGVASLTGFIIMPWLLVKYYYKGKLSDISTTTPSPLLILITLLITLVFFGVNAPFIEWNQSFVFPEFLSGIEEKLKAMEETLATTSAFITNFDSIGQLLLGMVVVAVIPGIGEELVFRGLVQNHVYRLSKNIHLAIWGGALLFSLFHLQFYGLVPRMFLGVLFGYLYYFSGNIIYPMVAHFFNNGFTLVMLYLFQENIININIEDSEVLPMSQVLISAVITLALIFSFRRNAKLKEANEELGSDI
jgi:membrane protease YdiL (CAAX protease family)